MVMCFVPDCKHYSERDTCRFFSFPKDSNKVKKWITAIRRQPTKYSLVCSCHFKNGVKDDGPSIFPKNSRKYMDLPPPECKKKKPKKSVCDNGEEGGNDVAEPMEVLSARQTNESPQHCDANAISDHFKLLEEVLEIMKKPKDEFDNFGEYVALELRTLKSDFNRGKLKSEIRKVISHIADEDEENYWSHHAPSSSTLMSNMNNVPQEIKENHETMNIPEEMNIKFEEVGVCRADLSNIIMKEEPEDYDDREQLEKDQENYNDTEVKVQIKEES